MSESEPEKRIDGIPEIEWLRQRVEVLEAELGRMKVDTRMSAQSPEHWSVSVNTAQPSWYTTYGD